MDENSGTESDPFFRGPFKLYKMLSYLIHFKLAKIMHGLYFSHDTKFVAMPTSLKESVKLGRIEKIHKNTFHLVKKIMKISPVDSEIALVIVKKKKLMQAKYIARSTTEQSWLNYANTFVFSLKRHSV